MFVQSNRGRTLLQYKGYRYWKKYTSLKGARWVCEKSKKCSAYIILNDDDEIIVTSAGHTHSPLKNYEHDTVDEDQSESAVLITSRKGKTILLFRNYTYRKQYEKNNKTRWVCSNQKLCRANIFTNKSNYITSAYEEHCHPPPKYYRNPTNLIGALKEPLIYDESD